MIPVLEHLLGKCYQSAILEEKLCIRAAFMLFFLFKNYTICYKHKKI